MCPCDREPFASWKEFLRGYEADAKAGRLFYVHEGGGETAICVDREVPADVRAYMRAPSEWFLLRAPSGRLCYGGVEDYRAKKKKITSANDEIEVPVGDYRVRWFGVDFEIPARRLEEHLGQEDFALWQATERKEGRWGCQFALAFLAWILVVVFVEIPSWSAVASAVLVVALFGLAWRRTGHARAEEIAEKVWRFCGDGVFDEYQEEFLVGKLEHALELRRLGDGEDRPSGGSVEDHL